VADLFLAAASSVTTAASAAEAGLALAEAGIGPGAADGLVPFTPALLAARLLRQPTPLPEPVA
jgi:hypothetical protein